MSRRVKNRRPFRVLAWRFMELKGWAVMLFTRLYIPHVSLRRRLIAIIARHNRNIESLVKTLCLPRPSMPWPSQDNACI